MSVPTVVEYELTNLIKMLLGCLVALALYAQLYLYVGLKLPSLFDLKCVRETKEISGTATVVSGRYDGVAFSGTLILVLLLIPTITGTYTKTSFAQ